MPVPVPFGRRPSSPRQAIREPELLRFFDFRSAQKNILIFVRCTCIFNSRDRFCRMPSLGVSSLDLRPPGNGRPPFFWASTRPVSAPLCRASERVCPSLGESPVSARGISPNCRRPRRRPASERRSDRPQRGSLAFRSRESCPKSQSRSSGRNIFFALESPRSEFGMGIRARAQAVL